jgi:hypothetical protein
MVEDLTVKREIVLEADAETLERMRKEGHARGFTVFCDEGERIGGAAAAGLFRLIGGLLTAHANFPVRGDAQNPYRQGQSRGNGTL